MQIRADSWHNKAMHGQFLEKVKGKIDEEKTWLWLTNGTLKKRDRSPDFAAQEQAIRTNAVNARIEKSAESPRCRLCKEADETIDHIWSCCKKIAQTDYKQRHNVVAQMTDRVWEHNTPDIVIVGKKKVWIIDVAIPGDSRVTEKQLEKITRYQDLKTELQRLWHKPVQ
ncbi:hypothetical protein JRQ81_007538, partial [Phrynocephalus forsythii]